MSPQRRVPFHLTAVSARIAPLLHGRNLQARVESVFAEACNLVTAEGERFALVSKEIGNGPLSAVVDDARALSILQEGQSVSGNGRRLRLNPGWTLTLDRAPHWNPYLSFEALSQWPQVVQQNLSWLRAALPSQTVLAGTSPASPAAGGPSTAYAFSTLYQSRIKELTDGLQRAYRRGNLRWLTFYARRLAGLGPGLTPAGDDWLAGWHIGLHARAALESRQGHRASLSVKTVGVAVLKAATGRTSGLSLAFLHAAVDGAAPQAWHNLAQALASADPVPLREATSAVLRHGASSGRDMLTGFMAALE